MTGMRMKKSLPILLLFFLLASAFGEAHAQFAKPEFAIKYRQSVMFLMSQHFGRMAGMVNGKVSYNKEVFADNAMIVETLSRLPWQAFMVPGTDKGDTALKSSAFEQQTKFKEIARTFENQTAELLNQAKIGDFDAIKTQFGEVGKICKACHSQFRTQ
jgi:cytochrome c556